MEPLDVDRDPDAVSDPHGAARLERRAEERALAREQRDLVGCRREEVDPDRVVGPDRIPERLGCLERARQPAA